jgi:hypothetical protein
VVPSTPVTLFSCARAVFSAAAALSVGVVARLPMLCCWATEAYFRLPAESVARTKSPPVTGRPL